MSTFLYILIPAIVIMAVVFIGIGIKMFVKMHAFVCQVVVVSAKIHRKPVFFAVLTVCTAVNVVFV